MHEQGFKGFHDNGQWGLFQYGHSYADDCYIILQKKEGSLDCNTSLQQQNYIFKNVFKIINYLLTFHTHYMGKIGWNQQAIS